MPDAFDAFAVGLDIVVAPHRLELGTQAAQLVDEIAHRRRRARAGHVDPERAHDEARHALPVVLDGARERVEEDEAQDVALRRRNRAVIDEPAALKLAADTSNPPGNVRTTECGLAKASPHRNLGLTVTV